MWPGDTLDALGGTACYSLVDTGERASAAIDQLTTE
jgi:hypothetical protein